MRYFIDTNIFWFLHTENDSLDRDVQALFADYGNLFYISSVSVQELIHLRQTGKMAENIGKRQIFFLP